MTEPLTDLDASSVLACRSEIAWRAIDDELVVVNPGLRAVRLLNGSAAAVFDSLDGVRDLRAVAEGLARRFATDVGAILDDVIVAARQLGDAGLLDGVESAQERLNSDPDHEQVLRRAVADGRLVGATSDGRVLPLTLGDDPPPPGSVAFTGHSPQQELGGKG